MIHGVLNIYKEKGFTSHDVVAKLRGIVGQKKIGHTGTLDPDAVGVLPVCLGKATRLCDMLTAKNKTYETVMLLGKTTDTQDISGKVLAERETKGLRMDIVQKAVQSFQGEYQQIPPMYSARKINGKKLYELAREGKEVERQSREVHISRIRILEAELPRVRMEIDCSKGTYIRTLCHDIGKMLGCGACMEELIRTCSGSFSIKDSLTLEEVEKRKESGTLNQILLPTDSVFSNMRAVVISNRWSSLAYNGNRLTSEMILEYISAEAQEKVRVYDESGEFIGIYKYVQEEKAFAVEKMFLSK